MNRRWLITLLLISLAFNLAVLGSYLYFRSTHDFGHRNRWNRYAPALRRDNPGPGYNPAFSDTTRALWREFSEIKAEFMKELAKDPLDMDALDDLLARTLANQAILENHMAERLIRHRLSLTPEEAKEFYTKRYEEIVRRQKNRRQLDYDKTSNN
ncbi:MAG TPA: hypothetical protein PL126_00585 [Candidatus Cloacimonadota bacterium]|nr:hypothetical protein [Candidatus Cloacimonadota bacterium]